MPRLNRLRQLRQGSALSQHELAAKAGLSRSAIARIETGQDDARPATIRKLADALRVEPRELAAERMDREQLLREDAALAALVEEAKSRLRGFIPDARFRTRLESDPDYGGDEQVVLGVSTDLPEEEALAALRRFDREWWVQEVTRAGGRLCVDLVDD